MHESDYWPEDQRQYASCHLWPKDGSDWALVIGIPQGFRQIHYNPISMNKPPFSKIEGQSTSGTNFDATATTTKATYNRKTK